MIWMCSSNVQRRICIDKGKGFSQRMTLKKTHEAVQITKPNHNNQQARGSSSRGLVPKELARIHGKSAHLANCSQLFKKSF